MNEATPSPESGVPTGRDEMLSGLFTHLVMQQTNLALMLLGRTPHPETGKTVRDLDGAQMFIDQLEMIETKTRGNLNPTESRLLQQSLTALRMAFVETVNEDDSRGDVAARADGAEASSKSSAASSAQPPPEAASERRTKFSKSY
jgi:hypothetical protein